MKTLMNLLINFFFINCQIKQNIFVVQLRAKLAIATSLRSFYKAASLSIAIISIIFSGAASNNHGGSQLSIG